MVRLSILFAILLVSSTGIRAATLDTVGGQLVGAFDVEVDGILYDVVFDDGTCPGFFGGCDSVSDFVFQDFFAASAASAALGAQVFTGGSGNPFDNDPTLTRGCGTNLFGECFVSTPYSINDIAFLASALINRIGDMADPVGSSSAGFAFDSTGDPRFTWAIWSVANPVPVPAAIWLFAAALPGLIALGRRRASGS